jgi:hypothetical protein
MVIITNDAHMGMYLFGAQLKVDADAGCSGSNCTMVDARSSSSL